MTFYPQKTALIARLGNSNEYTYENRLVRSRDTSHLTIAICGQHATGKIQKNNYHHWNLE